MLSHQATAEIRKLTQDKTKLEEEQVKLVMTNKKMRLERDRLVKEEEEWTQEREVRCICECVTIVVNWTNGRILTCQVY